jgi:predicted negative regulator of RcsB-dependent stress response
LRLFRVPTAPTIIVESVMTKRHPGQRKRPHGSPEHEDDVFIAKVLEIGNWAKANQQLLTTLGVLAVLAVAAGIYYANYRRAMAVQASNELEAIHQSVSLGDTEGAKQELIVYLERFGGSPYAAEARMLLGELYLAGEEAQQAQAVLEPLAASPRRPIELQTAALLGAAYEQEERWDEAEAVYLRIADRSDLDFQIRDALASAARIRANHGNPQGAAELYERILEDMDENEPERGLYEMRLAELTATS